MAELQLKLEYKDVLDLVAQLSPTHKQDLRLRLEAEYRSLLPDSLYDQPPMSEEDFRAYRDQLPQTEPTASQMIIQERREGP